MKHTEDYRHAYRRWVCSGTP